MNLTYFTGGNVDVIGVTHFILAKIIVQIESSGLN